MVGIFEGWLAGKAMRKARRRLREKLGPVPEAEPSIMDLAPAPGARWLQLPDGTWKRWSYLGEAWEATAVLPPGLPSGEHPNVPVEWVQQPDGSWERRDV